LTKEKGIAFEKEFDARYFFPVKKNNKLFCPKCDVELEFDRHFVGMMDRYRVGNEGDIYKCPVCGREFNETTIFRD
jgi:uncharacterized protein with PIN domain